MAKTTAQRQEHYRDRITATHKRIELILELETFEKLAQLVKISGCHSRIAYMTGLIVREHQALQDGKPLPCNDLLPDNTTPPQQPLPGHEKPEDPFILWRQEPRRCQYC